MKPTLNKKIDKKSELGPTLDKRIDKNLYKELGLTPTKKINKSLNKKLRPSFVHNDMHLRKKTAISIIKTNSKVYKLKIYDEAITNPIHSIRW